MPENSMKVEVFHDTACPWCRIGKRHLQIALEDWQREPVEVSYRAFFLNPALPSEGGDFQEVMHAKGGGRVSLEAFFDAPRRAGAAVGLTFNFEKITRAPNTLLSHQLIALAPEEHRAALIDAVYAVYFEHGQDIGDVEVLVAIAAANGLDPGRVREQLISHAARLQVEAEARWAQQHGIRGVPFFVINQRYAFSGAQPPEVIKNILKQAASGKLEAEQGS